MISTINKARELSVGASEAKLCQKLIKNHICLYLKFQNYFIFQHNLVFSYMKYLINVISYKNVAPEPC